MPDIMNEVLSFHADIFRVVAPRLERWEIAQASQPCWRLWWNTGAGAHLMWRDQRIALGPGTFVLVAPGTDFEARLTRPIERHLFIHFGLGAHRWRITDRVLRVPVQPFTRALVDTLLARLPTDPQITFDQPLLGVALIGAVLADVPPSTWNAAPTDARVQRVIGAIESNPGQPWPDAAMAKLAAMSTGGFIRVFRREIGASPQRYLARLRLARASSLLLQTPLSLEAIAEHCGFSDRSYFSTVFRREIGVPTARFRAEGRRGS